MSSSILKLLALIFMIIDHIGVYFIKNPELNTIFRTFGRMSAPLFFFVFTIGFIHTTNREKYKQRLFVSALIMEIGKILLKLTMGITITANILFTLWLGFLFLENIENYKKEKAKSTIVLIILTIMFYYAEYSYLALLCIIAFYFYNKSLQNYNKSKCDMFLLLVYALISIIYPAIKNIPTQAFMILSIIPIIYYNRKKGYNNKIIKNFYYIFYIVHIWIFAILEQILL